MGIRLTADEAHELGIITESEKKTVRRTDPRKKRERAVAEDSPQSILQHLLVRCWPEEAVPEMTGAAPGRKFRLDVGFPGSRLAVECDGWEYHGKHKADFKRDRERDRALVLEGWCVLRFYASEIRYTPDEVIETIAKVKERIDDEKGEGSYVEG